MQKQTAQNGRGGVGPKNGNLGPCTKLNQKCMVKSSGWPHQNVSIYFSSNVEEITEQLQLFEFCKLVQNLSNSLVFIIIVIIYLFSYFFGRVTTITQPTYVWDVMGFLEQNN